MAINIFSFMKFQLSFFNIVGVLYSLNSDYPLSIVGVAHILFFIWSGFYFPIFFKFFFSEIFILINTNVSIFSFMVILLEKMLPTFVTCIIYQSFIFNIWIFNASKLFVLYSMIYVYNFLASRISKEKEVRYKAWK